MSVIPVIEGWMLAALTALFAASALVVMSGAQIIAAATWFVLGFASGGTRAKAGDAL